MPEQTPENQALSNMPYSQLSNKAKKIRNYLLDSSSYKLDSHAQKNALDNYHKKQQALIKQHTNKGHTARKNNLAKKLYGFKVPTYTSPHHVQNYSSGPNIKNFPSNEQESVHGPISYMPKGGRRHTRRQKNKHVRKNKSRKH